MSVVVVDYYNIHSDVIFALIISSEILLLLLTTKSKEKIIFQSEISHFQRP